MDRDRLTPMVALAAALCLAGCGDGQTGVPQPDPLPLVRAMRATQSGDGPEPVQIVGLAGAVAGAGRVTATIAGKIHETQATSAGTFVLVVEAAGETAVELRYEQSPPATLTIAHRCPGGAICANPPPPPGPRPGVEPVSAPVDGKVIVRGQAMAQNAPVVIANIDGGDARSATAGPDGAFDVEIGAGSGDAIFVYHESGTALEPPWQLTVP